MSWRKHARGAPGGFGIGIASVKTGHNVGTLMRSALQLGADFVFTVRHRYKREASDTYNTMRHIPLWQWESPDDIRTPHGWPIIGVDFSEGVSQPIVGFAHPRQCVYLLGAEDHGLPKWAVEKSHAIVSLPSVRMPSYNVAVAGSLVMYDRLVKASGGRGATASAVESRPVPTSTEES